MKHRISQLGYVGIEISDRSAWHRFATNILGLEDRGTAEDGSQLFRLDENDHRLALHEGPRDDLAYVGWEAEDEASLRAIAQRLEERGARVVWATEAEAASRKVAQLFRVHDPNGMTCEVYRCPLKSDEPLRSPRAIRGFEAGHLGFGHVVLCVDDYEESLRFYCDGLGLLVSDYIDLDMGEGEPTRVAFLHAGPRHHSIAIAQIPSPKRLHHFMLQVKHVDDVGSTFDLCQDEDVPVTMSLGKHTNDQMFSFYMQSPSGFQVEWGHGGIEIDDDTWEIGHYQAPSLWGHRPPA